MAEQPVVSVVMSVFNGERFLEETLSSLLVSQGVPFEIVVVDDGSTDGTAAILVRTAATDSRVRLIRQENTGLTRALVRGCSEARGRFIARQDNGDLSASDRFRVQADVLENCPGVAIVGCWASAVGPAGEHLQSIRFPASAQAATRAMLEEGVNPIHGSVMFRRADYVAVGGYRPEFYFAQDSDLWMRLADRGLLHVVPEFLYANRVFNGSISAWNRDAQVELNRLAAEARKARDSGEAESPILAEASAIRPGQEREGRAGTGTGDYFIGRLLLGNGDRRAVGYLRAHLRQKPWDLKGWLALAGAVTLTRRREAITPKKMGSA